MSKNITGLMFYYYFVCKRKLWYFDKYIQMEDEYDLVKLGKLIDENSYKRKKKHINIDNTISVDFMDGWKVIHEVKKSRKIEPASIWQLKYYLYYLEKRGVENLKGMLDYPKLKKRKQVELNDSDREKIEEILQAIKQILESDIPKRIDSGICKKCAYYELCYI